MGSECVLFARSVRVDDYRIGVIYIFPLLIAAVVDGKTVVKPESSSFPVTFEVRDFVLSTQFLIGL